MPTDSITASGRHQTTWEQTDAWETLFGAVQEPCTVPWMNGDKTSEEYLKCAQGILGQEIEDAKTTWESGGNKKYCENKYRKQGCEILNCFISKNTTPLTSAITDAANCTIFAIVAGYCAFSAHGSARICGTHRFLWFLLLLVLPLRDGLLLFLLINT